MPKNHKTKISGVHRQNRHRQYKKIIVSTPMTKKVKETRDIPLISLRGYALESKDIRKLYEEAEQELKEARKNVRLMD